MAPFPLQNEIQTHLQVDSAQYTLYFSLKNMAGVASFVFISLAADSYVSIRSVLLSFQAITFVSQILALIALD
jgi:hypothetical protein